MGVIPFFAQHGSTELYGQDGRRPFGRTDGGDACLNQGERLAERLLIKPRKIDYRTNVFASKVTPGVPGVKPVTIEMIDANTKELVETLEVRLSLIFARRERETNSEESRAARSQKVDACMVATGRVPNTKTLGLESMGIETFRGFVQVSAL